MRYPIVLLTLLLSACGQDDPISAPAPDPTPVLPAPSDPTAPVVEPGLLEFRDVETGSRWNMRGEAVDGPLAGRQLEQLAGYSAYWFAWSSFWQDTAVWDVDEGSRLPAEVFAALPDGEFYPDVPRDAIPPLDHPPAGFGTVEFVPIDEAGYLRNDDLVVGAVHGGEARAYPVKILNFHEIVNHTVGGRKIALTYCPLTASGINFAADAIAFGNTGGLYNNNMVMYDRESASLWSQMRLNSIIGSRAGEALQLLPVFQGTWAAWKNLYPDSLVLTEATNYRRNYRVDSYVAARYTTSTEVWFPQTPPIDPRFHPKTMVLGLLGDNRAKAYPFSMLGDEKVINDRFAGRDLAVVYQRSAQLALAFDRRIDDRALTFELIP